MAQVAEIINASKKTGVSQRGPWNIASVRLDDGKEVDVFGNPSIGQEVTDLQYDSQYNSWKGKLAKGGGQSTTPLKNMSDPANVETSQLLDAVRKVYAKQLELEKKLDDVLNRPMTTDELYATAQSEDNKETATSDIPF